MAWTLVRTDRESFNSTAEANFPGTCDAPASWKTVLGAEGFLAAFIGVQAVGLALMWLGERFDPVLAICQSLSLLTVAGLFATKRTGQHIPATAAAVLPVAASVAAPPVHPAIQIDEQSQTWADLMGRISHEIRTPLNAVIGFSDLMEREIFGPLGNERYRDYLAHIRDSGEALLRSAEDTLALSSMLAVSAPGPGRQSSSLAALAQDAWIFVAPQAARRGIELTAEITDELDVAGDRRAFRQALSNLMVEAVSRACEGSRIEIKAVAHGDTVRVKITTPQAERHVRPAQPSLAVCVARALLELQGTSLSVAECNSQGRWQATTVLDLTVQPDFFG